MTPEEQTAFDIRNDPQLWFEVFGTILNRAGELIRPLANSFQARVFRVYRWCRDNQKPCRIIILKPRRKGSSTVSLALCYSHLRNHMGYGAVLGDDLGTTAKLMETWNRYVEHDKFKHWGNEPGLSKRNFSHGSKVYEETANDPRAGMGGDIHFLLASEAAHYRSKGKTSGEYVMQSVMNSVPNLPNSCVIIESTPNGTQGVFYNTWQSAVSFEEFKRGQEGNGYIRVFAPWFEFDDSRAPLHPGEEKAILDDLDSESRYNGEIALVERHGVTADKLKWRRQIIDSPACGGDPRKFQQEYPSDAISCIAGDIRIGTDRGLIPIKDAKPGMLSDHGKILAWKANGERDILKITTNLGFEVLATPEHPLALAGGEFCPAGDSLGKTVVLQAPRFAEDYYVERWEGFAGIQCEFKITEDWGRFLGYFMGDGCFKNGSIEFATDRQDADVREDIVTLLTRYIGTPAVRFIGPNKNCGSIRVSRKEAKALFERMGWATDNTQAQRRKICVPECIWRSPKPVVTEFLRALFEADGWVSPTAGNVKFFCKDPAFGRDVQLLLLGYGIYSKTHGVIKRLKDKTYTGCELFLNSYESQKFLAQIGFVSARKRSRTWTPRNAGRKPKIYDGTDEVVSVTPAGSAQVYDIEIEGRPVFGAAGILVHNCFLQSGSGRFDSEGLDVLGDQIALRPEPQYGILEQPEGAAAPTFIQTARHEAWVRIWEFPKEGRRYIGADDFMTGEQAAGSRRESDCHATLIGRAAYIDDSQEPHKAAIVAAFMPDDRQKDLDIVAERIALLSKFYGGCLMAPEVNNLHGIIELIRRHGANLWMRKKQGTGKTVMVPGFQTNVSTKRQIIGELATLIREQELEIPCPRILAELRNFIVHSDGTEAAAEGAHDDWVMALAILAHVLPAARVMESEETKLAREARRSAYYRPARQLVAECR